MAALILAIIAGCSGQPSLIVTESTLPIPGDWPTSTPEEQGMDSALLTEMLETIKQQNYKIDAVIVIRNGVKVLDANFPPFTAGERHVIYSCTKSVVSALIGIAIEQGYIKGVDQPVLEIFPDHIFTNRDAEINSLTIENLLTMSTGLDCQDSYLYRWKGLNEMWESDDWIQYVLDLPMIAPPGEKFEYCNGASFLLAAILQETTGMTAHEFAKEHLFAPLNISNVEWDTSPQGYNLGYAGLYMLPQDMAKFGQLYLQQGKWGEKQIVPADWVTVSTSKHIRGTLQPGYGYQWWLTTYGPIMALGYQGQYIIIVPDLDLVAVFVSDLPDQDFYVPEELLTNYIIPSTTSEPLAKNPVGIFKLQTQIRVFTE